MTIARLNARRALLALLAATALACGKLPFSGNASPGPALIVFINESMDQADVYGISSGTNPVRIGTVMAGRTDTLTVPAELTAMRGSVNIIARIFASSKIVQTGTVSLYPGEIYQVRLGTDEKQLTFLPGQD